MTTDERIERLESANRRFKTVGIALAMCLVTLAVVWLNLPETQAQDGAKHEVSARSFVVVDKEGDERITLRVAEGGPRIDLYDGEGNSRAVLSVIDGDPALALYDDEGNPRARMRFFKQGPAVLLYDEKRNVIWQTP